MQSCFSNLFGSGYNQENVWKDLDDVFLSKKNYITHINMFLTRQHRPQIVCGLSSCALRFSYYQLKLNAHQTLRKLGLSKVLCKIKQIGSLFRSKSKETFLRSSTFPLLFCFISFDFDLYLLSFSNCYAYIVKILLPLSIFILKF